MKNHKNIETCKIVQLIILLHTEFVYIISFFFSAPKEIRKNCIKYFNFSAIKNCIYYA